MTDPTQQQPHTRGRGCLIWIAVPAVVLLVLLAVLLINNRPPNVKIPTPKMPNPNGWDDFVRAAEISSRVQHYGPYSQTRPIESWTIPEYEAFVADNAPALHALREGLSRQYLHPPIADTSLLLDHCAKFRELARTLAGEAKYYEVTGQPGRATDSLLDSIEFGVTVPRGGPLIVALVGYAIETIGARPVGGLLPKLDPENLKRTSNRFERIQSKRVTFPDILRSEAISSEAMVREATGTRRRPWSFLLPQEALNRHYRSYLEKMAKEQVGPYVGPSHVPPPKGFPSFAAPVLRSRLSVARSEATLALIQVEVALRRYKADHGGYPDRLSQLKPDYLSEIPVDPFGGKQLRYRPTKQGQDFLLYSVGPNLQDDGGKLEKWSGETTPGDILLER